MYQKTGRWSLKKGTTTFEKHGWEKEHYYWGLYVDCSTPGMFILHHPERTWGYCERERKGTSKIVPCEILKILKNCILPTLRRFTHFKQLDWLSLKHDPLRFSKFALDKNPTIFCNEEQACLGEWELTLFKWSSQKKGLVRTNEAPRRVALLIFLWQHNTRDYLKTLAFAKASERIWDWWPTPQCHKAGLIPSDKVQAQKCLPIRVHPKVIRKGQKRAKRPPPKLPLSISANRSFKNCQFNLLQEVLPLIITRPPNCALLLS